MSVDFGPMHAALLDTFGEAATYLPAEGAPVPLRAVPAYDTPVEDEGGLYVRRTTVQFASGAATPRAGDRITLAAGTWFVDRMESDDGHMTTVVLGRKQA